MGARKMTDVYEDGPPAGSRSGRSRAAIEVVAQLQANLPILIFGILTLGPVLLTNRLPDPLILAACLVCFFLLMMSRKKAHSTLHFFYIVFLYLGLYPFYVQEIAGVSLNVSGRQVSPMSPYTFAAIVLFLLTVAIAAAQEGRRTERADRPVVANSRLLRHPLFFPALAMAVCCSLGILVIGVETFFASRFAASINAPRASALTMLMNIMKLTPCWFMFFLLWKRIKGGYQPVTTGTMLLGAAILAMNNPITTPRYIALTGILVAVFPLLLVRGRLATLKLLFPVLVWVVLPPTSLLRAGFGSFDVSQVYGYALSGLEFSSMTTFNEWLAMRPDRPAAWGLYTLSAIFVLVPRAMWPGKNPGTGIGIAEEVGYSVTNVGVPPIAEPFLDFGWLGIAALGLVTGLVLRRFPIPAFNKLECLSTLSCIPIMLFALTPIFVRGDLGVFFRAFYTLLIAHRIAIFFVKLRA